MGGWIKRIVDFFRSLINRPGLPEFIKRWLPLVVTIIQEELAKARVTNPEASLHDVMPSVFKRVTEETATPYDNWAVLVIGHAWEWLKVNKGV